jgi:uncharacterized protein with PIN domain
MKRFIADAMLGKLARWMRMMGCDAEKFTGKPPMLNIWLRS